MKSILAARRKTMSRVSAVVIGRLPTTAPTTDSVSCWQQFPLGVLLLITNSPFQDSLIALGIVFEPDGYGGVQNGPL